MIYKTYRRADFCPKLPKTDSDITLTAYARPATRAKADNGERWAVLVLPGGGYKMLAPSEGEPIALAFLAHGMQAFVLKYSIAPARWPQQLLEAAAAVAFIRQHAEQYGRIGWPCADSLPAGTWLPVCPPCIICQSSAQRLALTPKRSAQMQPFSPIPSPCPADSAAI